MLRKLFNHRNKRNQGVYWQKGAMPGCCILFQDDDSHFCIGSDSFDGPSLLIDSDSYVYLSVTSAKNGCPNDYMVIEDFDGPSILQHSGYIYEHGGQVIQLL